MPPCAATCKNLEMITLSEVSQAEKEKCQMMSLIRVEPKNDTVKFTYKIEICLQT